MNILVLVPPRLLYLITDVYKRIPDVLGMKFNALLNTCRRYLINYVRRLCCSIGPDLSDHKDRIHTLL